MVNGKQDSTNAKKFIKSLNEYRKELDEMDVIIDNIVNAIHHEKDLSTDEYNEYKATLKYLLKD